MKSKTGTGAAVLASTLGQGQEVEPINHREKTATKAPSKEPIRVQPASQPVVSAPAEPPKTTPPIAPVNAEPPKPMSFLDKIKRVAVDGKTNDVIQAIKESRAVIKDNGAFGAFLEAIDAFEALAGFNESDMSEDSLARKLRNLSFAEIMDLLESWTSNGDKIAAGILDTLKTFNGDGMPGTVHVDIIAPLWQRVQIVRGLREIGTFSALSQWLRYRTGGGDVSVFSARDIAEKAVVLLGKDGRSPIQYLPATPTMEVVWKWVKEAEVRAKAHAGKLEKQIKTLKGMATGITPAEAKDGKDGKVYLSLAGVNRGVLFHVCTNGNNGNGPSVRVETSVGTNVRYAGWITPVDDQSKWPDSELFAAFCGWWEDRQ